MLRDNLVELIKPMPQSAGANPLALSIQQQTRASDDRLSCLENPRPEGAESSLTENVTSPFQAEPAQKGYISNPATKNKSVWLSEEGAKLSEELFEKLFAVK